MTKTWWQTEKSLRFGGFAHFDYNILPKVPNKHLRSFLWKCSRGAEEMASSYV